MREKERCRMRVGQHMGRDPEIGLKCISRQLMSAGICPVDSFVSQILRLLRHTYLSLKFTQESILDPIGHCAAYVQHSYPHTYKPVSICVNLQRCGLPSNLLSETVSKSIS